MLNKSLYPSVFSVAVTNYDLVYKEGASGSLFIYKSL